MMLTSTPVRLAGALSALALLALSTACGPSGNRPGDDDGDDGPSTNCSGSETRCNGLTFQTCQNGTFVDTETCTGSSICLPGTGCADCNPAVGQYCVGDTIYTCNADGTRGTEVQTCAFESCAGGMCQDACSAAAQNRSYIGCEYWPVDLDNAVEIMGMQGSLDCLLTPDVTNVNLPVCPAQLGGRPYLCDYGNVCPGGGTCSSQAVCVLNAQQSPYAVVVSNPDPSNPVMVTLTNAAGTTMGMTVAAGAVQPLFPQMMGFADQSLDYSGIESKAYKLTSDRPIVAYQFNPLNNVAVFSNDASLLIPAHAFDTNYIALIYPTLTRAPLAHDYSGYVTIVAAAAGQTTVTVKPTAGVRAGNMVPAIAAGATQMFTLNQFQTLNLEAIADGDLSGTEITCAPSCGVFVGTEASGISKDQGGNCCADHLEEQLFPSSTWGKVYALGRTQSRGAGEPDLVRVMAQKPNTTVTFNPPPASGTCGTLNVGQFCEVRIAADTEISSPEPILVAHYLMSIGTGGGGNPKGDPAIAFGIPTEQFRMTYTFLVPSQYAENHVTLVAPASGTVMLDGNNVTGMLTPFGSGTYKAGRVAVQPGQHKLDCPDTCGVEVYGYDGAVSYLFAGGLDLEQIVVD
jgi:hypothetical protein